tara:strand:+ start:265 stop:624 length:360 start_codon:yes stop_codon:yes gene_type:complete
MIYSKINSPNESYFQSRRPDSVNVVAPSAKLMPSTNNTAIQTLPLNDVQKSGQINHTNYYASRANKRQSPSNVSAEAYFNSRISLKPVYIHNEMITRIQNISDLTKNPPRFKDQINLLA